MYVIFAQFLPFSVQRVDNKYVVDIVTEYIEDKKSIEQLLSM